MDTLTRPDTFQAKFSNRKCDQCQQFIVARNATALRLLNDPQLQMVRVYCDCCRERRFVVEAVAA